ncbi:MAG TPA: hypothetical protein VN688_11675 [Gemmataceae bacterium]|nr:hypothetical protein [Gemmataceae bacterium]
MSPTTTSLPLPTVSADVRTFAEEQGVTPYLPAVLALARRIFPTWPIKVFLEDDPEIANDWHIILEVQVPEDADADTLFALGQQWTEGIFQNCPATHVCVFRLGMA